MLDKELEEKLNKDFDEYANHVIFAFEQEVKDLKKEFGEDFHVGIEANYTIRTDNEDVLAIDTYIVNTVASSSTRHKFYNIDKKTGKLIEFKDLFKEEAKYTQSISKYIESEMRRANNDGTGNYWLADSDFGGFKEIKEDQNFYINDNANIVICFDKYEVAPGAYGCVEFEIPSVIISEILK